MLRSTTAPQKNLYHNSISHGAFWEPSAHRVHVNLLHSAGFDTNNPDFSILNFCTARHKTVNSFVHRWTRALITTNFTCLATTWGEVKMCTPARKRKHLHYVHHWTATNPGHRDDKSNGIQPCSINHAPAPSKIDQQSLSPGALPTSSAKRPTFN